MTEQAVTVTVRDSTLWEGLDTPGVSFSPEHKLRIAALLDETSVPEAEVVAPSRVLKDRAFVPALRDAVPRLVTSGLIYAAGSHVRDESRAAGHRSPSNLDHPDLFEAFEPGLVGATRTLDCQ